MNVVGRIVAAVVVWCGLCPTQGVGQVAGLSGTPHRAAEKVESQRPQDLKATSSILDFDEKPLEFKRFDPPFSGSSDLESSFAQLRDRPNYSGWGILIGAAGGAVWGTLLMKNSDDWVGPPAHMITVPVGGAVGGVAGWLVGRIIEYNRGREVGG